MHITNKDIAKILKEIAAVYIIKDEKKYFFQIAAYQRAAGNIENLTTEVRDLYHENKLQNIPGVGSTIQSYIVELIEKGRVKHFEDIKKDIPSSFFPLLNISNIGPKTAYKLIMTFKLFNEKTVILDLKKKAKQGEIAKLATFGPKSENKIMQAIIEFEEGKNKGDRMLFPFAYEIAEKIINYLKKCPEILSIEPLGSLRRRSSTVGDIDIAVASNKPKKVIDFFIKYPYKNRIIEAGGSTASILTSNNRNVDIMVASPQALGSLLQHLTGSKAHNIHLRSYAQSKGLSLSEYGIKKIQNSKFKIQNFNLKLKTKNYNSKLNIYQYPTEKEFYEAIGMQWIPPEIREDTGEIELAIKNRIPELIDLKDIKGDMHIHSSYNIEPSHDLGSDPFKDILDKAESLGYQYIGFSEHNPSLKNHTPDQYYNILLKRNINIEQIQQSTKSVHIFKLLEVDIAVDGSCAIENRSASSLDGMIVSVHSSFNLNRTAMTKRIIKGLSHPKACILGHPTGRLLNQRESYDVDWDVVFEYCYKNNKAIEISAWPNRLDPPDNLIKEAVYNKIMLVINSDSHAVSHMDVLKYGVMLARRGWAAKENVLNTKTFEEVRDWFHNR